MATTTYATPNRFLSKPLIYWSVAILFVIALFVALTMSRQATAPGSISSDMITPAEANLQNPANGTQPGNSTQYDTANGVAPTQPIQPNQDNTASGVTPDQVRQNRNPDTAMPTGQPNVAPVERATTEGINPQPQQ